jgi:methionyl-tRNA formyltransferase
LRLEPDAGVIVAYGEILPRKLLEAAPLGFVNVHFSLLPKYRGAAPVQWAIASGEKTTGVTTMAVAPKMDAGDIFLQKEIQIAPDETAPRLGERLAVAGASLLLETLDAMARRTLRPRRQEHEKASYAPRLSKDDGWIDWSSEAVVIARRVRGFDPWPGCFTRVRGRDVRLLTVDPETDGGEARPALAGMPPGTALGLDGEALRIVCGGMTVLRVTRMQFQGGKSIGARDAVNGRLVAAGDTLGEAVEPSGA